MDAAAGARRRPAARRREVAAAAACSAAASVPEAPPPPGRRRPYRYPFSPVALFTVLSPIFMPCRPWHATSVTEWSSYTKKPYPLLFPVSGSTTSLNDFVGPNASTSSLTMGSVR